MVSARGATAVGSGLTTSPTGQGHGGAWVVQALTSVEWGLLSLAWLLASLVSMGMSWDELRQQWTQDWGSSTLPWVTLALMPVAFAFDELGRCLMWVRWRGGVPRWRLQWVGICPVLAMHPDEVWRLRRRAGRVLVHLWCLLHACSLTCLGWVLSQSLKDPAWQWVARCWMYASGIVLVCVHLNPFWQGAMQHLLEEWMHLPDLARRSRAWWKERLVSAAARVAGVSGQVLPATRGSGRLSFWAICHALLGWGGHWALSLWLITQIDTRHPHLALLLLASAVLALFVAPACSGLKAALRSLPQGAQRRRLLVAVAMVGGGVSAGLLLLPWPRHLMAPAVVVGPESSQVVAPIDGVISDELVLDGQSVYEGQALWHMVPWHLRAVDRDADDMLDAPGNWGQAVIRSAGIGRLLWLMQGDPVDRVVRKGQVLAQLIPSTPPLLRWVVPAARARDLQDVQRICARLIEQPGQELQVSTRQLQSRAVGRLPARALSARLGGAVAVLENDPDGMVPTEPMLAIDAPLTAAMPRLGGRAWVKMELTPRPLGLQWADRVRDMWIAGR